MSATEAAAYFAKRPLGRVLLLLRDRLIELGWPGGTVELPTPAREEVEALRAFFGGKLPRRTPAGALVLELRAFAAELQSSRFGCGLREALEAYFGEPIVTRRERRAQENEQWSAFLREMAGSAPPDLASFAEGLRAEWRQDPISLGQSLQLVFRACAMLPYLTGQVERLAVFATRVAGDPHAFDADRPAGRLLERALLQVLPVAAGGAAAGSAGRALLLAAAGLERDDLSATVLAVGLLGSDPLLAAARQQGTVLAFPLRTVRTWQSVAAAGGTAYVVENPAVLGAFLDQWHSRAVAPQHWPAVICTSGQLGAADVVLLDRLVAGGATLMYSGDFDVGGLRILRWLRRRYGQAVRLWRYDAESYRLALATGGRLWSEWDRKALAGLRGDFPDLVAAMLDGGRAAYQEALALQLWEDMRPVDSTAPQV